MSLAVINESMTELSDVSLTNASKESRESQDSQSEYDSSYMSEGSEVEDEHPIPRKPRSSKKSKRTTPSDDQLYDTDLEIEDEKPDYHVACSMIYLETCRELGVVPASYFLRHINDDVIRMRHHGLGTLGAHAIAVPLVSNTTVLELDLQDNWLEAEGARHLSEMLKENISISHLNLAENRLGTKGCQSICDALLSNSSITDLNLSGNDFQDKDARYLAAAFLENNTVQDLDLSHNELGSGQGHILAHAIGENETIEVLDISWNHFRGRSAMEMVDAVKGNSRLKTVNLSWNGLGNEGALAIADCIKNNNILLELDITSNRITVDGAEAISKGLDVNETLRVFKMGMNAIGTSGALIILNAINNERSVVEELDITGVCVCKEFISMYKDMQQSREIVVKHGQVIGDYVIKGSPPKKLSGLDGSNADMSEEALQRLENFLENDPMARIVHHLKIKNLRLIDLFNQFDKDKSFTITIEEFKKGVKNAKVGLSEAQVDELIGRLDRGVKDGVVDYRELSAGTLKAQAKQRAMTRCVLDTLEGRPLSASSGSVSRLDRLLPGFSRSLSNLSRSSTNPKGSSPSRTVPRTGIGVFKSGRIY